MIWLSCLMACLGWGALAFGANYTWAYQPLAAMVTMVGLAGIWSGRRSQLPTLFISALILLLAATLVQLIPLSISTLSQISPQALEIVRQRDLAFSSAPPAAHPISISPSRTWLGLGLYVAFAIAIIGTMSGLTRTRAKQLSVGIMILGVLLSAIGIVQAALITDAIYGFWKPYGPASPFGPFVNKNHFAGWMLMAIPVSLGYFLSQVSRGMSDSPASVRNLVLWFSTTQANRTLLAASAVVLMSLSLVLTLSRSGIAALVAALLIAGSTVVARQRQAARRAIGVAYLMLLPIAVASWVGVDRIVARFSEVDLASINQRPAIWADTIRIVNDFWLTGTGLNTYGIATLFYQTSVPGLHLREAHNDYLQLASEGGLLLAIPIALAIFAFARQVSYRFREDVGSIWWIRMGAVTGLIAIALQSFVDFSLQMPGNATLFSVVAGLAIHDGRRL